MEITLTKTKGALPVTVLHLDGKLDGASFELLVKEAEKAYTAGERDLLLDLSALTYISSAGLAGLHRVALLFRGEQHPGQDEGWAAYRAIARDRGKGFQEHVKLVSPDGKVRQVLDMTGFDVLFEIFTDLSQALASFQQPVTSKVASMS